MARERTRYSSEFWAKVALEGKRLPVATVGVSGLKFQGRSSLRRSMVWPRQRRSMTAAM